VPWYVQYRRDSTEHMDRYRTPEAAIEAACVLMDNNYEVYEIGMGPPPGAIDASEIVKIYQLWLRRKYPFGLPPR